MSGKTGAKAHAYCRSNPPATAPENEEISTPTSRRLSVAVRNQAVTLSIRTTTVPVTAVVNTPVTPNDRTALIDLAINLARKTPAEKAASATR
jgi:hypothetical protein